MFKELEFEIGIEAGWKTVEQRDVSFNRNDAFVTKPTFWKLINKLRQV